MKKTWKRLCTGFLALATVVTALPTTPVHAESKQYWTESAERVGIIEKVMNDGSIGSTFNEGYMKVEGETAYCIDINTDFKNGYKTRADASSRMSADQISDVALSLEYVKQYGEAHKELNYKQVYLLEQCVVWQRLSVHLGWQCDNVRASYDEIPKATQDEVFSGAKAFVKENKGRYECGGYIYSGEGQELGQFWAKLNVGNAKLQKTSSNTSITDGNGNYSIAGATYGVFSDKDCTKQLATLTTDENGNTDVVEVKAGTVYIKELSAPAGYKVDKTVYSLKVEAGKTATLKVSDTPKVTDTLIELFKIDMETQKDNPQGNASLAGAEFTWKYYAGFYNKDNLPAEATRTWVTKTIAETDSDGTTHYITKLADAYKVSGDSFYMQDGKAVLPLGTLTVEETKAPNGYLLEGAYMQAGDKSEQIKGLYVTQITEDGDLAVLSGSNQFSVSDKVIRGGVKIQKRDLETGDTKPQGSATLKDTAFDIISLNDNSVLVEGKLYKKNEVVKTILYQDYKNNKTYTKLNKDGDGAETDFTKEYFENGLVKHTEFVSGDFKSETSYTYDAFKNIKSQVYNDSSRIDYNYEFDSKNNRIKIAKLSQALPEDNSFTFVKITYADGTTSGSTSLDLDFVKKHDEVFREKNSLMQHYQKVAYSRKDYLSVLKGDEDKIEIQDSYDNNFEKVVQLVDTPEHSSLVIFNEVDQSVHFVKGFYLDDFVKHEWHDAVKLESPTGIYWVKDNKYKISFYQDGKYLQSSNFSIENDENPNHLVVKTIVGTIYQIQNVDTSEAGRLYPLFKK